MGFLLLLIYISSVNGFPDCSSSRDCVDNCAYDANCNENICSYSSYKSEGRFCLNDVELSTCDGNGICFELEPSESDIIIEPPNESDSGPCHTEERHRKPWHMITPAEKKLYTDGYLELHKQGKIEIFTATHADTTVLHQAHGTSAFQPWHRYFIWELESQFRNLGGKYKCFSLPFWDSTHETQIEEGDYYILNSGLGASGVEENNYCVEDGPFASGEYIPSTCQQEEECCLRRKSSPWTQSRFLTPQAMLEYITDFPIYGDDNIDSKERIDGFGKRSEGTPHGRLHTVIGGSGHLGSVPTAVDDPIFFLLHASVDYLWALWQDCYNYDEITEDEITSDIYTGLGLQITDGGVIYGPSGIDDDLNFGPLENDITSFIYNYKLQHNGQSLTPRDMHNITRWNVSYEKGQFYYRSKVDELEQLCLTINSQWFYEELNYNIPKTAAEIFSDDTFTFLKYKQVRPHPSDIINDEETRHRQILEKWSTISCEYSEFSLNKPCIRPLYFDICDGDPKYENVKGDIDISLDELLERVGGSECMMETRRMYYEWAKQSRKLRDLCNGEFDQFCENQFAKKDVEKISGMESGMLNEENNGCHKSEIINGSDSGYNNKILVYVIVIIVLICLLSIFGLLIYIWKLKNKIVNQKSYELEQEMVTYYGSVKGEM